MKQYHRDANKKDIIITCYSIAQACRLMHAVFEWCNYDYIRNYFQESEVPNCVPNIRVNDVVMAEEPIRAERTKTKFKVVATSRTYSKRLGSTTRRKVVAKGLTMEEALDEMMKLTGVRKTSAMKPGGIFSTQYEIE